MNAEQVLEQIEAAGIVPVVRASSAELARRAVGALYEGGLTVFEITLTVPGALELIQSLSESLAGKALVGVGTVVNAEQAGRSIDAGAQFIVSPGFDAAIMRVAAERGVLVAPGVLTPTEVMAATAAGARMVKVFPCSAVGGASYLKALRGPFPKLKLLPTGGVDATTAADYIGAGASALGVGGNLVDQAALQAGQDHVLTERARQLVAAVRAARG